jgi:hypothetical protein
MVVVILHLLWGVIVRIGRRRRCAVSELVTQLVG